MILTMIDGMWCYYEHFNYKKILYLWNSIKGFQGFTKVEMMVIDLSELESCPFTCNSIIWKYALFIL